MSELPVQGPGFFGKVRTHGDFVSRRLAAEFVTSWDEHLQEGMLYAQETFGAQWLPIYLNAPVWCFAVGAGVCGESAWIGVLMSSVDRVGRYFPFTIAAPVKHGEIAEWLKSAQAWFDDMTRLALATLAPEFVLEAFDAQLNALGPAANVRSAMPWRLSINDDSGVNDRFADLLAAQVTPGASTWWSEGSDAVPPSLRTGTGLPDGKRFTGLLDAACPGWPTVVALRRS
ncbi:type VI secretion system-associated protein TagF [Trinickia mobilis]|uniref:type VI secretion system-associated protein TagF n=1 Tax=Trinickia mobilis TaxID=2816356 RepID=UPI001A8EB67B|nr:type VI secretion system-associated protein TagF [Trinickia mobilis]